MNALNEKFLAMLKTSLWGDSFVSDESVSPADLYKEALRYEVAGITSEHIDEFCGSDVVTRQEWSNKAMYNIMNSARLLTGMDQLNKLLKEEGIKPVILKGMACAHYYHDPMRRSMGDIDFIVPLDEFDKCAETLYQNGYETKHDSGKHIELIKNGIEYELHRYITLGGDEFEQKLDTLMMEMVKEPIMMSVEGVDFYSLNEEGQGIELLEHLKFHIYDGVGFRQLLDWIVYVDRVLNDDFWNNKFQKLIKGSGLERFAKVITRTAQKYVGLKTDGITWCSDVEDEVCEDTIEYFFGCNNFGYIDTQNGHQARLESLMTEGLFGSLKSRAVMHYPEVRENKLLLPIAMIRVAWLWGGIGIKNILFNKTSSGIDVKGIREKQRFFETIGL